MYAAGGLLILLERLNLLWIYLGALEARDVLALAYVNVLGFYCWVLVLSCYYLSLRWACLGAIFGWSLQGGIQATTWWARWSDCRRIALIQLISRLTPITLRRGIVLLSFLIHIYKSVLSRHAEVWDYSQEHDLSEAVFGYAILLALVKW